MIKKFNELNESAGEMISVEKNKWGGVVNATITLDISGYLSDGDDRTEIPYEEALVLIMRELESLSGSNDGSELLANVGEDEIKFK
jgi:hypothetical protein